MAPNSNEIERTEALLRDAVRLLTEPATTYTRAAAVAVVIESIRQYRRAVETQRASVRGSGQRARQPV